MWFNLYGREAVRCKLKNRQKTQKMHFLPVFELTSDSLSTIEVEPHQCPSHQSILLTQGPIHKILQIFFENWWFWKTPFFWVGHNGIFFASSQWKLVKVSWISRMGRITLVFQPKITPPKHFSRQCICYIWI
jgi:hypothetical protein